MMCAQATGDAFFFFHEYNLYYKKHVPLLIVHNVGRQSFQKTCLNPPSSFKGQQSNSDIPFSFSHPGQKNIQMWSVEVFVCQS